MAKDLLQVIFIPVGVVGRESFQRDIGVQALCGLRGGAGLWFKPRGRIHRRHQHQCFQIGGVGFEADPDGFTGLLELTAVVAGETQHGGIIGRKDGRQADCAAGQGDGLFRTSELGEDAGLGSVKRCGQGWRGGFQARPTGSPCFLTEDLMASYNRIVW
jgi:hypothetical protein